MRILLPPSETKAPGGHGPPLDLDLLAFPELNRTRARIARELVSLARDVPRCRAVLGLSARQDAEVARNAALQTSPTMPAIDRYTGVRYDALDPAGLTPAARRRADRLLVICSALFGALRPSDPIPAYRLSGGCSLPRLGPLAALWRAPLCGALGAGDDPVIDLRSGAYAALAPLPSAVVVRVVSHDGRPVSHHNKAAKGRLARALVTARREPVTLAAAIRAAQAAGLALTQVGERKLVLIV
jgi:cytoplasmic iron level regulating protein YaaA (DUF328/UPF0246 family)